MLLIVQVMRIAVGETDVAPEWTTRVDRRWRVAEQSWQLLATSGIEGKRRARLSFRASGRGSRAREGDGIGFLPVASGESEDRYRKAYDGAKA